MKISTTALSLFFLISGVAQSRPAFLTVREHVALAASGTDTIFYGEILDYKIIKDGVTYLGSEKTVPIALLTVYVLKAFRGNLAEYDTRLVCTWFDYIENSFYPVIGKKYVFFGVDAGNNIQLPRIHGNIYKIQDIEEKQLQTINKSTKKPTINKPIFDLYDFTDSIDGNKCDEPE